MKYLSEYQNKVKKNQRKVKQFRFTVPAASCYPSQWLWDSCFQAIIYTYFDIDFAKDEIRSLLTGQWENGMLPHMIYWVDQSSCYEDWGTDKKTSCITQPPMAAYAVETIYKKDNDLQFAKEVLEKLHRYYVWLDRERSAAHLPSIIHSWESGEDHFVAWDEVYGVFDPAPGFFYTREKQLLAEYVKTGLNTKAFLDQNLFNVRCPLFCSVYLKNLQSMQFLCEVTQSEYKNYYAAKIPDVTAAFHEQLFDREKGIFSTRYNPDHYVKEAENSSLFLPLFAGIPTKEQADILVKDYLLNENKFWLKYPVPTVSAESRFFHPDRYWRGTTWININWFIIKGLENYGYKAIARDLKKRTLALVEKSGFREYYNPHTAEGLGPVDWAGWSGLIFDL